VYADRIVIDAGTPHGMTHHSGLDQVPVITAESWITLRAPPAEFGGSYRFCVGGDFSP
jgi:hypothetical protein